jgi:hypothetical protein
LNLKSENHAGKNQHRDNEEVALRFTLTDLYLAFPEAVTISVPFHSPLTFLNLQNFFGKNETFPDL